MSRTIMIQGTASNAGKSLITAGLCRIFAREGYKTAPFKSQNMALNSYITRDGLEMGRAQVMQAEAARAEPSVLMNPILLKPTSDVGSQVIVMGEVTGTLGAADYHTRKKALRPIVETAFAELSAQNDIIVIEGAGSPAEINLRENDFVNMGMAEIADCPVLLVGDIDRGGVFASLYGTAALLTESERARIKGFIINKFRGDVNILRPGLDTLENLTGIPVLGVVPYMRLDIDDEDSLSDRFTRVAAPKPLDIAVVRLPRISNFTDFNALSRMGAVSLRYVSSARELGKPDLVILPGTKNTMGDLRWLRENGLEASILKLASAGTPVFGVCGGYQMLGLQLSDPDGAEEGGELRGMGLLPARTLFLPRKTRTRVTAEALSGPLAGVAFEGYEIHMGQTSLESGAEPFARLSDGRSDGAVCGGVAGSYIHGLFDGALGAELVKSLLRAKGLEDGSFDSVSAEAYKDSQYDALADGLLRSLDMERIYTIMGVDKK